MRTALRTFDRASGYLSSAGGFTAGMILLVMVFIVVYEIISRHAFNAPTVWSIELVTFLLVWFGFMTLAFTQRARRHVHVDLLVGNFSPRTAAIWSLITLTITLVFTIALAYYSWGSFWRSLSIGETTTTVWGPPYWPVKLALPFGCFLLGLQLIFDIASNAYKLASERLERRGGWRDNPFILVPAFLALLGFSVWLMMNVPLAGLIVMLLLLLFAGVPIFASLGLIGMIGLYLHFGGSLAVTQVPTIVFSSIGNFTLAALPLFILAGFVLQMSGAGEELYDVFTKWIGHWPGGLALATILSAAFFSAITISSVACAATVGLIALPSLMKRKYNDSFSYGVVGAGATLGIMIPPSATMILYAAVTEESLGQLLMAGLLPGIVIVIMFAIYAALYCRRTGAYEKGQSYSWKERFVALKKAIWVLLIPVIIIAGIFSGVVTVLECGAVASLYAIIMVLVRRKIKVTQLPRMLTECGVTAGFLLIIIAGALTLGRFMTLLEVPQLALGAIASANLAPWVVMVAIMLLLIVLGLFLEVASVMMITLPILYPLVTALGFNGIWFAVLMTLNMEMALITPPIGLNLYVIQGIAKSRLAPVIRGIVPFFLIMVIGLIIIYLFPQLSLVVPHLMIK
ncbi:MAG: TRAP transporter large permease subunit [Chloroflexota bacterium]|nr:TRAP transporter large permease subunit [Chloroflexota bacterium]